VQSALTGHQVLTSVHANSVYDVMGRFRHFGLDIFGFASSLNGVIVQRLIRRLCPACGSKRLPTEAERTWLLSSSLSCEAVARANGCQDCRGTGYQRRAVIAEVHRVDDRFRDLVIAGAPMSELRAAIEHEGHRSLQRQAAEMVARHTTTPEEIKRVVGIA
jgi:general secretion pathway protein E